MNDRTTGQFPPAFRFGGNPIKRFFRHAWIMFEGECRHPPGIAVVNTNNPYETGNPANRRIDELCQFRTRFEILRLNNNPSQRYPP